MKERTPEEKEAIMHKSPVGTFILLLLVAAAFVAGWSYMYWNMFIANGPVS